MEVPATEYGHIDRIRGTGRRWYPLEAAPVWRYTAKDALKGPQVRAVAQFRDAVDESEKQHQQKH